MAKEKDDLLKRPARLQAPSVPKRRWGIALLLGFGVLVNYFDRVNLSVSRDALQASFGVSLPSLRPSPRAWEVCLGRDSSWGSVRLPHFRPMRKPLATGFPRTNAAWPPPCLTPRRNFLRRLEYRYWVSYYFISAGAGILRRRASSVFCTSRCSTPSIGIRARINY